MNHYSNEYFSKLDKRKRANVLNCLHGYKSPILVGTKNDIENLALFSNVFHLGADPHLIGLISRPNSVERHTIENIKKNKHFTLNYITKKMIPSAHQTSARYERCESEFKECNFKTFYSELCTAPYLFDSNLKLGLKLKEIKNIELNNTDLIIGEVFEVFCRDEILEFELKDQSSVCVNGLDRYYEVLPIVRLNYAKKV